MYQRLSQKIGQSLNQKIVQPGTLSNHPKVLKDGNTVAWYDSNDSSTLTLDSFNRVSRWNDKLGSGHDLIQSGAANLKPIKAKYGIQFDGQNDYLKTSGFEFNEPVSIYLMCKNTSFTNWDCIVGSLGRTIEIIQRTAPNGIALSVDSKYVQNAGIAVRNHGIIRAFANGNTSKITIDNGVPSTNILVTPSVGMDAITLGATGTPSDYANVEIVEAIFRKVADNSDDETMIYNYLYNKYSSYYNGGKDGFDNAKFALTFDDARTSVYTVAFPIMTEKGIKCTIYVNGNDVGTANRMTWDQIIEMHNAGHDIQCHTFTHNTSIDTEAELLSEFNQNNTAFVAHGLPAPLHFAYPGGVINDNLITWIKNSGLRLNARMTANRYTNGYINKSTNKWDWGTNITDTSTLSAIQAVINNSLTDKSGISTYIHEVGSAPSSLQMDVTIFTSMLDYAIAQGLDFITVSQLYQLLD